MKNFNSFLTLGEINQSSTALAVSPSSPSSLPSGTVTFSDRKQLIAFMAVAKIAHSVTVKIDNASGTSGSGVIINRQGNTYTVLTANHVVNSTSSEFTIHTNKGNDYAVTQVIRLQQCESDCDVAFVQFFSRDAYPVASFGNLNHVLVGTDIYVFGYPQAISTEKPEFEKGMIISHPSQELLRYNAPNLSGMIGAPVFNTNGQVIGIHLAREVDQEIGTGIKIPGSIDMLITLLNQTELISSDLEPKLPQTARA